MRGNLSHQYTAFFLETSQDDGRGKNFKESKGPFIPDSYDLLRKSASTITDVLSGLLK